MGSDMTPVGNGWAPCSVPKSLAGTL